MSLSRPSSASVLRLLNWQVTHQAAVKSTNTGRPSACSAATRSGLQACQATPCTAVAVSPAVAISCIRVTFGPMLTPSHSSASADRPPITARPRPRSPSAQTSSANTTSSVSNAAAPSMPLCCPSTHSSQTTVANIGKAMNWRKCAIQAPGRGSARAMAGHQLAAR